MNMQQTQIMSKKKVAIEILKNVQILYQNGEIDATEKNRIANELREAMQTDDFSDVKNIFTTLSFGTLFPEVVRDCINLSTR